MNTAEGILELLKQQKSVAVPGFGVFSTIPGRARLDAETNRLLPPARQVSFEADYGIQDEVLQRFMAANKNIGTEAAAFEIKTQAEYWKKMLLNRDTFTVPGLGGFFVNDSGLEFRGERLQAADPSSFGLEEVVISDIATATAPAVSTVENSAGDYRLQNSVLWTFLVAVPLAGMAFLAFTQSDRLFGKESFSNISVQTSTHRIPKDSAKTDSLTALRKTADSLKQDSVAKAALPVTAPVKKWVPKKKWTKKNYTANKWKPRKRKTH